MARLQELRGLLELYETADLEQLLPAPDGRCLDCARRGPRLRYGNVAICERCARARIRVRNAVRLQ